MNRFSIHTSLVIYLLIGIPQIHVPKFAKYEISIINNKILKGIIAFKLIILIILK